MNTEVLEEYSERFVCEQCNKVCKHKRGLAIHQSKCREISPDTIHICKYCTLQVKSIYNLNNHYMICQELKIHNAKEELKLQYEKDIYDLKNHYEKEIYDLKNHYETSIKDIRRSCESQCSQYEDKIRALNQQHNISIKSLSDEHKRYVKDIETLEATIKTITSQKATLETKISDLESKNYYFMNAYIQKDQREKNTPSVVNYNTNHTGNNIQLLQFDMSAFVGKIQPPNVMVRNVDQLIGHFQKNGLSKYYTVTDRSRKSLLWIDESGQEVKDTNGTRITSTLLKGLEPDLKRQIQYLQEDLNRLQSLPDRHHYTEEIQERIDAITFCQTLFSPVNIKLMNKITKGIASIAKNPTDKSVDTPPQAPGFKNLVASLVTALFPEVNEWFTLSPSTFGAYLYKHLRERIHVEQPCLVNKTLYILNDQNAREKLSSRQFAKIIQDAIEEVFTPMVRNIVLHLYSVRLNSTTEQEERQNQMMDWIDNLTQPFSDQIVEGICRAGLS
jgi:hypothetical protein